MDKEQAYAHWMTRFTNWTMSAADPPSYEPADAQDQAAHEQMLKMAEANVDRLLQGYAPHQVAIALARGASLLVADMVLHYESDDVVSILTLATHGRGQLPRNMQDAQLSQIRSVC